jgi:hypothetical protein
MSAKSGKKMMHHVRRRKPAEQKAPAAYQHRLTRVSAIQPFSGAELSI